MNEHKDDSEEDISNLMLPLPLASIVPKSKKCKPKCLGPFEKLTSSLSDHLQVPFEISLQSVLSVASLAAQGIADVQTPFGVICPLSLSVLSVVGSGSRKSNVDKLVSSGIKMHEELSYQAIRDFIKQASHDKPVSNSRFSDDALLGCFHIISGPNFDDFTKQLPMLPASVLYESPDALQFTRGSSRSGRHSLSRAGELFERAWSGNNIMLSRGSSARLLRGRRISISLTLDDGIAAETINAENPGARSFLAKTLIAWPDSLVGQRSISDIDVGRIEGLEDFKRKCVEMLRSLPGSSQDSFNEITPRVIKLDTTSKKTLVKFIHNMETYPKSADTFSEVVDFIENAAENICRIAAIYTIFDNKSALEISEDYLNSAIELYVYYLYELLRIRKINVVQVQIKNAQILLSWLKKQSELRQNRGDSMCVGTRTILQRGPSVLRSKQVLDEAIKILQDHGWVYMQYNRREIVFTEK